MPSDNDDGDALLKQTEHQLWQMRELARMKEDKASRTLHAKEKEEVERRRNLTDEQRQIENLKLGADAIEREKEKKNKTKYRFMQKYYHEGAFYKDDNNPLMKRDYNTAVGEDLWDKSVTVKEK